VRRKAMSEPSEDDTEGHAKRFFAKPDDEATDKDAASATDEADDTEDVEGHIGVLRPDRDVTAPRAADDERPAPPQRKI
jgi:hypothetical protein